MFKKITDSKWLYVVLSILMSIMLWSYVIQVDNTEQNKTIRDIPVTFTGADVLETRQLIISKGSEQTIDLPVKVKLDVLNKLNRDNITLTVDVSKITEEGEYRLMAKPTYPPTVQSGSVIINSDSNLSVLYVKFTVSKSEDKQIPIKAEFKGKVAEGYQLGNITITPATISISGQSELVDRVAYAKVVFTQDDLRETYSGDLPFEYIDVNGDPLTDLNINASADTVYVTYPVVKVVNVPLAVDLIYGGGITAENLDEYVDIDIQPKSISVSGEESALATLSQLFVGQIDLNQIITSETFTFPIDLGQTLTNESGVSEVTVKVSIKGLTTREFDVEDIQPINYPEGYTVETVTQSRTVMVRGPEEAVNAIFKSQLRIVVDVSAGIPAAAVGRFDIPAKVYLSGSSDVGVVGTYNISISLSK